MPKSYVRKQEFYDFCIPEILLINSGIDVNKLNNWNLYVSGLHLLENF